MNLIPVFVIGLLGSVHCFGMCGGIVSALSMAPGTRPVVPISIAGGQSVVAQTATWDQALRVIAYNAGRIASYAMSGAIVGGIADGIRSLPLMSSLQLGGYWFANLILVALGLYLMEAWRGLVVLERAGRVVWRRVQPLTTYLLPMDSFAKAMLLGALWGWLPCGMVYSVLLTAMLTGTATNGATVMFVFGLGTLPMLFVLGMLGSGVQRGIRRRWVRIASGAVVLAFGALGLVRAASGIKADWFDAVCLSPTVSHAAGSFDK